MSFSVIPPAGRIGELSAINAEVAAMLRSAGDAINALAGKQPESQGDNEAKMETSISERTMNERKEAFAQHTEAYYTSLQSIVARLRRQAYALEEAGIIASDASILSSSPQAKQSVPAAGQARPQTSAPQDLDRIANGGLGTLDVGWLNSRGNKIGVEKEGEVLERARALLEDVLGVGDSSEGS